MVLVDIVLGTPLYEITNLLKIFIFPTRFFKFFETFI